jgi:hypothetical protein
MLLVALAKKCSIDDQIIAKLSSSADVAEAWKGNWTALMLIMGAGLFNRVVFYRDRFEADH